MDGPASIGLAVDVTNHELNAHIRPLGLFLKVTNNKAGLMQLIQQFEVYPIRLIALESAETMVARTLMEQGFPTVVVSPQQMRDFAEATGRADKTNAEILGYFAENYEDDTSA